MRNIGALIALGFVCLLLGACQNSVAGPSQGGAVMTVDGRTVTAEEIMTSGFMRTGLTQYVMYQALKEQIKKRGIEVDYAEVERRMAEQKERATAGGGQSWDAYLAEMGYNEEDLRSKIKSELEYAAYIESMIEINEDDVRRRWEQDQEQIIEFYLRSNHLPESERANVTFEDARPVILEGIKQEQAYEVSEIAMQILFDETDIELVCVKDDMQREQFEFLIYDSRKSDSPLADQQGKGPPSGGMSAAGASSTDDGSAADESEYESDSQGENQSSEETSGSESENPCNPCGE